MDYIGYPNSESDWSDPESLEQRKPVFTVDWSAGGKYAALWRRLK